MDVEPYNKIWLNYFLPIAVDSRCQSLEFQNEIDQFKFFFVVEKHTQRQVKMKQTKTKIKTKN